MTSPQPEMNQLERHLVELVSSDNAFKGIDVSHARVELVIADGNNACVAWRLLARHGARPTIRQEDMQHGTTFLGWHATGRQVVIPVVSVCRGSDPAAAGADDWHHSWDRLSALAQIGVRAVGRPVLRAVSPVDSLVPQLFPGLLPQS